MSTTKGVALSLPALAGSLRAEEFMNINETLRVVQRLLAKVQTDLDASCTDQKFYEWLKWVEYPVYAKLKNDILELETVIAQFIKTDSVLFEEEDTGRWVCPND